MIRINLLPHRERKRVAKTRQIAVLAGATAGLGVFLVVLVHLFISARIDYQNQRNDYLKKEIAILDSQIQEIKKLKEQTRALLARKQVVEKLQDNRSEAVNLLDQLARRIPEGVYLRSVKEETQGSETRLSLNGYSQSSARVSTLMRNLDESPWFSSPSLVEVKASTVGNLRLSEFSVNVTVSHKTTPDGQTAVKTP